MLFLLLGVVGLIYWALQAFATVRLVRHVPFLDAIVAPPLAAWPRVSLVIPARDEAEEIEAAVRSRLEEGYPDLEVIVVNDRSSDSTAEIIDRLSREDPRVIAVHLTSLPPGWLGKQHAMNEGLRRATGEYVLFSDADIHFRAGVLRRCIAFCEAHRLDHLALMPQLWRVSLLLDATLVSFARAVLLAGRPWRANVPQMRGGVGVGAFNLVRRSTFLRTPGFEWMKMEVSDDLVLGQMLRNAGGRGYVALAGDWVGLRFYGSLSAFLKACERGAHAFKYRLAPAVLSAALLLFIEATPFIALGVGNTFARILGALALVLSAGVYLVVARSVQLPRWLALLGPVGTLIFVTFMAVGAARVARQGGLIWRGTLYPSKELLAASRFELP